MKPSPKLSSFTSDVPDNPKNRHWENIKKLCAAFSFAALELISPNANADELKTPPYRPTLFARLGFETLSTTTSTSETGDSFVLGAGLPYPGAPDWVDPALLQLNVGMIGKNGLEVDVQASQGATLKASDNFDATASLGLGFAQFGLGLDAAPEPITTGYATGSANLNGRVKVGDGAQVFANAGVGAKAYFAPLHFPGEELPRTQVQATLGGALGVSVDVNSQVNLALSTGLAWYFTDHESDKIWGDAALTLTVKP